MGDQTLRFCQRNQGWRLRVTFRSSQLETIRSLIAGNMGISLIPARAKQESGGGKPVYRSLAASGPQRTIAG